MASTRTPQPAHNLGEIVRAYGKDFSIVGLEWTALHGRWLYEAREYRDGKQVGPRGYISDDVIEQAA